MKLSLDWIQEFIDLSDLTLEEILHKINTSICETEEAVPFLPHLESIVPVKILSKEKHPGADKLFVTQVLAGDKEIQVVTNSAEVQPGDVTALALPGTVLEDKKILESEVRGVKSGGMFCCGKDLGICDSDSGVFVLNASSDLPLHSIRDNRGNLKNTSGEDFILGRSIRPQLGFQDVIIDIDNKSITHRPDLWSHFGFARELAAQFERPLVVNPLKQTLGENEFQKDISPVKVQGNENAHSYRAIPIEGVTVSASSMKFRSRLIKTGVKCISNVVDVSNYLLMECGQPTHFFDRSQLSSDALEVDYARKGETFTLLDESSPELEESVLLIRSGGKPVAIAGVMGGMESAVFENTKALVLESAVFKREDVRKSIKKTGIRSDASIRYEKGLDSSTCIPIIHRAIELLRENGNPDLRFGEIQGYNNRENHTVTIRTDLVFLQKKLGKVVSAELVEDILTRLGFKLEITRDVKNNPEWEIAVPFFRKNYDVTIPEDLVEEIGRTIGYASIQTQPLLLSLETPIENEFRTWEKKWKTALALRMGYHEVFNYSFASPQEARFEYDRPDSDIVFLQNEMPEEHSVLRTSIYPSLIHNAVTNQDRFDRFGLFEIGRTYNNAKRDEDGLPQEKRILGILAMGQGRTQAETRESMETEFLFLRRGIEQIFESWNIRNIQWKSTSDSSTKYFHPNAGLQLFHGEIRLGEMGILHNREADFYHLRKRPILFSLDLEAFIQAWKYSRKENHFKKPSQFPQGNLDISLVLDEREPTHRYANILRERNIPELEEIWVMDRFQGGNLPEGKASITYRVSLVPHDKTFTQERLQEITDILLNTAKESGFEIR